MSPGSDPQRRQCGIYARRLVAGSSGHTLFLGGAEMAECRVPSDRTGYRPKRLAVAFIRRDCQARTPYRS